MNPEYVMTAEAIGLVLHWSAGLLSDEGLTDALVAADWPPADARALVAEVNRLRREPDRSRPALSVLAGSVA